MVFLHPAFLWFAPLLSAPIIIHLLNRLRYRRVRWAAIDFLLASERRAVRRARLRHWILMTLRILLLAAALLAIAQPVFRGRLTGLLGGSTQVAIAIDSSASMAASDVSGVAFERARALAADNIASLPRATRVMVGTFAGRYSSPMASPLIDHAAAASLLAAAERTAGRANVPEAIIASADALARTGGGGTIWLLTDGQNDGWRADDAGAWQRVQTSLKAAGSPRLIVTQVAPAIAGNLSISRVRVEPAVLVAGEHPKLVATIERVGKGPAASNLTLYFDDDATPNGKQIETRPISLAGPGKTDVVFSLPALSERAVTGRLALTPDAMPADDTYYFVLRPSPKVPVLVVDGAPSSTWGEGSADYLVEALTPTQANLVGRSPFGAKPVRVEDMLQTSLSEHSAVILVNVPRLAPDAMNQLADYVDRGGLLIVFPGPRTQIDAWNQAKLPGVKLGSLVSFESLETRPKLAWAAPSSPVTGLLQPAWLDRVQIGQMYRIDTVDQPTTLEVLATAGCPNGDLPFLVRVQRGKGKVYVYAVSCQKDFSSLPFTPVMLLTVHREILTHVTELVEPLSLPACQPLRLVLPAGGHQMLLPRRPAENGHEGRPAVAPDDSDRPVPVTPLAENAGQAQFTRTERAGIYRMFSGDRPPARPSLAEPVAAINAPVEEAELDRISADTARRLVGNAASVYFAAASADAEEGANVGGDDHDRTSSSGFPLAVLAILFALSEVIVGWTLGRPVKEKAAV